MKLIHNSRHERLTSTYTSTFRLGFLLVACILAAVLSARPLRAAGSSDAYAKALQAHPGLRGHWQLDGDLDAAAGKAVAKSGGAVSYAEGVLGKALKVDVKSPVSVPKADQLRGRSATLEMFFKVISTPTGNRDLVLLSQAKGQPKSALFDLEADIGETTDVLPQHPEVAERLRSYVKAFNADLKQNSRPAAFVENPKPLTKRENRE